jgi:hypothetical protein
MARETGVFVDLIDRQKLADIITKKTGETCDANWFLDSGIISAHYNDKLEIRTINTEGVQDRGFNSDRVFVDQFAVYTFFGYYEFTKAELMACMAGKSIDLSEFVREFGQRLENNFWLAYEWVSNSGD